MKNQRRWKNLLVSPESQIEYGTLFLAVSIVVHAITTLICLETYAAWKAKAVEMNGVPLAAMILALVLVYLLLYGFAFLLGLVISHRLYGPMVAVERFVARLREGDYSARLALRRRDDAKVRALADNLNELAADLEKKSK